MKTLLPALLAVALAAPTGAAYGQADDETLRRQAVDVEADIISLDDWRYDALYQEGISAEAFIDDVEVRDAVGDEIGDVEDILVAQDGRVVAVVVEVGGVWDIGDLHVSVPWEEVIRNPDSASIIVPVTEEYARERGVRPDDPILQSEAVRKIIGGTEDAATGSRLWRLSEMIGEYARLLDPDGPVNYGTVTDAILHDDRIAAVVVEADETFSHSGRRKAFPFHGYEREWRPGSPYYDLPYGRAELTVLGDFDPARMK